MLIFCAGSANRKTSTLDSSTPLIILVSLLICKGATAVKFTNPVKVVAALFIEMLESVAPADAKLLCAIKEKKLPWKGITPEIVNEAFPGLLPNEQTT